MTLPSGGYPPGSITNPSGTGLSAHSQKTQAQWKAEQTGGVKNSFEGNFWANMIGNMFGGFLNGILGFISSLVYALKGITGGLIDLTGALKSTDQKATDAQNTADGVAVGQSNLAQLYNADIAANREKYPMLAPFSYEAAAYAYSAGYVILLAPAAGYPGYAATAVGQPFIVTPGEKIYLEWRQRRAGADYRARVSLRIANSAGSVIVTDTSPAQPEPSATNNTWAKYSGVVEIPEGAYRAVPEIVLQLAADASPTGQWAFDNIIVRRAVEADLTAIQAELAGKADYSDIPTNVPLWQSLNPTDDASFPLSQILYHTNASTSSSGNTSTSETKDPTFATSTNDVYFGYIRCLRDRDYTQVGLITAAGGWNSQPPQQFWVYIYKMDLATGALTRIWSSGDVKTFISSPGAQFRLGVPTFTAAQGDVFAVGIHQQGSVFNPTKSLYGIKFPYVAQPAGVLPRALGSKITTSSYPAAASVSAGGQTWDTDTCPWVFLG